MLIFSSCEKVNLPRFEEEGNALKRAAYDYNLQFVLERKNHFKSTERYIGALNNVDSTLYKWKHFLSVDSLSADYQPGLQYTLWNDSVHDSQVATMKLLIPSVDTIWNSSINRGIPLLYSNFISKSGWARINPSLDTSLYALNRAQILSYYQPFMKDDTLTDYSSWIHEYRVDPIKHNWSYTCARTLVHDSVVYGWSFVEMPLKNTLELLKEYDEDHMMLISESGLLIYAGEMASKILNISSVNPVNTNPNVFEKLSNNVDEFSVYHAKKEEVRSAFENILTEQSELERINSSDNHIVILAADVVEIKAKLIYVIQY